MDVRWSYFDISDTFLEEKAAWLQEERSLHHTSAIFFRDAGKLVLLSQDDYDLAGLAFFQAILGLERALRLHFSPQRHQALEDERFSALFARAVGNGVVTDAVISHKKPLAARFLERIGGNAPTHCHALSILIPKLRNEYMHGGYRMFPEFLHMTFQMREIADALDTKRKAS